MATIKDDIQYFLVKHVSGGGHYWVGNILVKYDIKLIWIHTDLEHTHTISLNCQSNLYLAQKI